MKRKFVLMLITLVGIANVGFSYMEVGFMPALQMNVARVLDAGTFDTAEVPVSLALGGMFSVSVQLPFLYGVHYIYQHNFVRYGLHGYLRTPIPFFSWLPIRLDIGMMSGFAQVNTLDFISIYISPFASVKYFIGNVYDGGFVQVFGIYQELTSDIRFYSFMLTGVGFGFFF